MIYTVFPVNDDEMPQDFPTLETAQKYAEEHLDCEYEIEWTEGECV